MDVVKVINHGNVFGFGDWYTFHCPKCSEQVERHKHGNRCDCGAVLRWPQAEERIEG